MAPRTKIVATVGPASESPETLRAMIDAGMSMARIGLAHGPIEGNIDRLRRIRAAAADSGRYIGVMADLPGPKVRAAAFPEGGVYLVDDVTVELAPYDDASTVSSMTRISVDYAALLPNLIVGDLVALGDGGVELIVEEVGADRAVARVRNGGRLQGRPGVNLPPERFAIATPTADDLRLMAAVMEEGIDAIAISFVRTAEDVRTVRREVGTGGPMLIAKVETQTAVDDVDAIIATADGVMVARGDLGVRLPLEDVPHIQKEIIRAGVAYGRPVITATQMLESMISAPTPTRAEVSDIANAVFDGTSALMLSAETAIGRYPVGAVATMARVAERAEREFDYEGWGSRLGRQQSATAHGASPAVRITSAITAAAWRAAFDVEAAAILCCTRSGSTARAISRYRPTAPLLAVTPSEATARQLSVAWGIEAVVTGVYTNIDDIVWFAVKAAVDRKVVRPGDIVAVLAGSPEDAEPAADVLRLVRVH
ncbi:MAG TPA: pyruvate kinase [Acidimicrobiales bacterium]|nr:pyruvate kinase [Acidimicrobiales bacterium]